jgi:hypothetical protein
MRRWFWGDGWSHLSWKRRRRSRFWCWLNSHRSSRSGRAHDRWRGREGYRGGCRRRWQDRHGHDFVIARGESLLRITHFSCIALGRVGGRRVQWRQCHLGNIPCTITGPKFRQQAMWVDFAIRRDHQQHPARHNAYAEQAEHERAIDQQEHRPTVAPMPRSSFDTC